jgi:hypothetical protein
MKRLRLFYWVLLLPLGNACQTGKSDEQAVTSALENPVAEKSPAAVQAEALAAQFGPILRGGWVNADYLAAVRRTKSPLQAFELARPVSEVHFNPRRRTGDSLRTMMGLGNHEGAPLTVYFRPGLGLTALPTSYRDYETPASFSQLGYQISARDTTLQLTTYSKARKVLARTTLQRVPGASLTELDAAQRAVNQLLLAGSYLGTDSLGRLARLQFTADGRVKGLKGFQKYDVAIDFGGGPGNDIDHIKLDVYTRHSRPMAYRHSGDTLHLYAATLLLPGPATDLEVETLVRGRRLFTLVRR